jgi:hypothetical protein
MSDTAPVLAAGCPSIERAAAGRVGGAAIVVIAAVAICVAVLAGRAPSTGKVESHSAAASARQVGITGASARYMSCAEDSSSTAGAVRVVRAGCSNRLVVCCVIEVTVTYRGLTATAVSSFDASLLADSWHRDAPARWVVACGWNLTGGEWAMSGCSSPVLAG